MFVLTAVLAGVRDRRHVRAAEFAVRDELSAAISAIDNSILDLRPPDANAFQTDAYQAYRLLLYRRSKPTTRGLVVGAYSQLLGVTAGTLAAVSDTTRENIKQDVRKAIASLPEPPEVGTRRIGVSGWRA